MSGPKHLWSGDWRNESARAEEQRPLPPVQLEEPTPEPQQSERRPLLTRRQIATGVTVAVLAVLVGVALAITLSGGGNKPSSKRHRGATATTPRTTTTGPTGGAGLQTVQPLAIGPQANWLGMQIVGTPSGAVVSTVALGSAGDTAGFEPGDVVDGIDGHQVNGVRQIRSLTKGISLGSRVSVLINRGSTVITVPVTLKERPTIQP